MTLAEIEFVLMLRTESPNRGTSGRGAWARARRERDAASGAMARVLVHVLGRPLRTGELVRHDGLRMSQKHVADGIAASAMREGLAECARLRGR